jgi:hypothetical protein
MQSRSFKPIWVLLLTTTLACLQSFTAKAGGEGFEIYLNNKLILRQAVNKPFTLHSLQLDKANRDDQLVIHYYQCGPIHKDRTIVIKDDKGNTIKEWKFDDASGRTNNGMTIPVKELLQLEKNYSGSNLNIVYYAQQLPKGRALSAIQFNGKSTTWRMQQELWPVGNASFIKK